MIIAMWSGPRNLSTAMMYSFGSRPDTEVIDEPFYGAYLEATGLHHPMREEILASQTADPERVCAEILALSSKPNRFLKLMTHHMLESFPDSWMDHARHLFLIRHPARVIASYVRKRQSPTLDDLGFLRQAALINLVRSKGMSPVIVDADDVLRDPAAVMRDTCTALGLEWTDEMLSWPEGGRPFDGAWAPHWYGSVHRSSGFGAPAGEIPQISGPECRLLNAALPIYDEMAEERLRR